MNKASLTGMGLDELDDDYLRGSRNWSFSGIFVSLAILIGGALWALS